MRRFMLAMIVALGAVGCGHEPPPSGDDGAPAGARRIVSLAPAITSTVVLLGGRDAIVGRTPWCGAVDPRVPVAWDGTSVDAERLIALRPTHVLFQSTVGGGPRDDVLRLAEARGWSVRSWRLDRLEDVRTMIGEAGEVLGPDGRAAATALLERFDRACAHDPRVAALGPVVLLFGSDPPTAFGPGSYVDDLWRALGGMNAVRGGAYPELSVEELAAIDPAWVVVVGSERLRGAVGRLPVDACRAGRIIHARDPGLLEPGASAIAALEALRAEVAAAKVPVATEGDAP